MPAAKEFFGDMTINGLLAHEYGHALQWRAGLVGEQTSSILVREQQADCLAGVYMRWVAEGHSPRFSFEHQPRTGPGDGRGDRRTGSDIHIRHPVTQPTVARHRSRPGERVPDGLRRRRRWLRRNRFRRDQNRRGNLPPSLFDPASPQSDIAIDEQSLSTLMELLGQIFSPANPPTLATAGEGCSASQAAAGGLLPGHQHDRRRPARRCVRSARRPTRATSSCCRATTPPCRW